MSGPCKGSAAHVDGLKLVEFLMAQPNGQCELPNESIAKACGWELSRGGGVWQTDIKRYGRARVHVQTGVNATGEPCCVFRVHYRKNGTSSWLSLIDRTGDIGPHADMLWALLRGYMSRIAQQTTERDRMIEPFEEGARHCHAQGNEDATRVLYRAASELRGIGTIARDTWAELQVILSSL